MRRAVLALTSAVLAVSAAALTAAETGARTRGTGLADRIDAAAVDLVATEPLAGISVAVERGGRIVHARGYGFADLDRREPTDEHTVYRFGSIGKMVTAALVVKLADRGHLDLDDRASTHVPGLPQRLRAITIRHLLTHTSGLPELTMSPRYAESNGFGMTRDDAIELISSQPLMFPPGSRWSYSNSGYLLLGRVVEEVAGASFGRVARREMIDSSGALISYCAGPAPDATGYTARDGEWDRALRLGRAPAFMPARAVNMGVVSSAGAFCGSVVDLLGWADALRSGTAAGPGVFERMTTPATLADGSTVGYGLGVMLRSFDGRRAVAHGGLMDGFTALLAHFPDDDLTIAAATNTSQPDASFSGLVAAALGRPEGAGWSANEPGRAGR